MIIVIVYKDRRSIFNKRIKAIFNINKVSLIELRTELLTKRIHTVRIKNFKIDSDISIEELKTYLELIKEFI